MRLFLVAAMAASLGLGAQAAAQTPTPAPAAPQARPRPRPRPTSTQIVVRDQSGTPVADAHVVVSGTASKEATTDANGTVSLPAMRDGSYRLRFEREGYITLERDVAMRTGQPAEIDIVLNAAPPPPPPPPPPPTPTPAPPAGASGPPVVVSIPAYLDKNFIGRDPLKESVFGCTGDLTTRLLQIRDSLAPHTHANLDEVLYIVAGEGTVRTGSQSTPVTPGSLSVVPRGVSHGLERRGKNPLIVLSMLAGAPCQAAAAPAASK